MTRKNRSADITQVIECENEKARRVQDYVAAEEPLEMRCGRQSLGVTLRTPGNDEELVAGFLFTEGIISQREDVSAIHLGEGNGAEANVAQVALGDGVRLAPDKNTHKFSAGSACGVCGKASIEQLRQRGLRRLECGSPVAPELLLALPDKLRAAQPIFGRTGGLHAAGLFDVSGELLVLREDIGRHNAVDKVVGWALLAGRLPLSDHILLVSGRGGFEIVQKAIRAGISLLASVSAPSSLAVRLARELGLTLVGFLRGRRFVVYSGEERIALSAAVVGGGVGFEVSGPDHEPPAGSPRQCPFPSAPRIERSK